MKSNAFISSTTRTRIVVNCGLLIAISIVLKILFEVYIPLGGFPSLRLNITALPIMLSGILFGPLAGFAVGFISDILCFIIKPGGPFFIGFTLANGLTGFIPGLLFMMLRKKEIKHLEWFNLVFIALMIAFAVFPIIVVKKSNLDSEYRSDHILFIVSVSQLVTSILLNTWFLSILYGQAVAVLLPARLITNIFLIPLYTIMLVGLLKMLPSFIKQR